MPVNDLSSFKTLYLQTAKENLQTLKKGLEKLTSNANDDIAIEEAHRSAHTLKSKSLVMGYQEIGNLAKAIEDVLYSVKNKTNALSQDSIGVLLQQTKQIEQLLLQV